jgi:preprotein translocase subunit SecD
VKDRNLMWRGLVILASLVLSVLAAYPLKDKLKLGLDLRGGMHLSLQVETEDAVKAETDKDMQRLLQEAKDKGLTTAQGLVTSSTSFEVTGVAPDQDVAIGEATFKYLKSMTGTEAWNWKRDGDKLLFRMEDANAVAIRRLAVEQALTTIENRINAYGVTEPTIAQQGTDRLVVQLPGVDDPERVKQLIKNTAFLEFRLVDFPQGGGSDSRETVLQHYGGTLPENVEILISEIRDKQGRPVGQTFYAVEKRRVVTGRDLKTARPSLGQFNQPIVSFTFTHEGGKLFGEATGANVGKSLAIVLDGKVRSAPRINGRITDSGIIEGTFTQQEVEDLSTVLRSGALPAGITYLEERTVGPSLGQESIDKGLRAGLGGSILVVLLMLVVYRFSGVNAVLSLALNIIMIFGALAYLHATLTLPGIAGIVLTIGMAVDANVLIFERVKEELKAGRTVRSALDLGFEKALPAIVDGNLTTLLAALFLFQFGTGPIRGFAVTLSIGIAFTLYTAIFVSRWLFDVLMARKERVESLSI